MPEDIEDIKATIARNMRIHRARLKLSQGKLAEACGVSTPYISYIENCKVSSGIATLTKIASALGITIIKLLTKERSHDHH